MKTQKISKKAIGHFQWDLIELIGKDNRGAKNLVRLSL